MRLRGVVLDSWVSDVIPSSTAAGPVRHWGCIDIIEWNRLRNEGRTCNDDGDGDGDGCGDGGGDDDESCVGSNGE